MTYDFSSSFFSAVPFSFFFSAIIAGEGLFNCFLSGERGKQRGDIKTESAFPSVFFCFFFRSGEHCAEATEG